MEDYQERVIVEQAELATKLKALRRFINSDAYDRLDGSEQNLLHRQQSAMSGYDLVLRERIDLFPAADDDYDGIPF